VNEDGFAQGLTANGPDVSAEVKNILNNPVTLLSPLTGNLDVNAKQLISMIPENTSSDPTGGTEGELYYHTGRDRLVWWDGTASHTGASLDHAQTFRAKQTFASPTINTSILGTAISDINPPVVNSSVASAGTSATVARRDHKHTLGSKPSFSVHKNNTGQTITSGADILLTWAIEEWDTDGTFASNRHTPTAAGKYFYSIGVSWTVFNDAKNYHIYLYKNGSRYKVADAMSAFAGTARHGSVLPVIVDMNGTTDYVEVYVRHEDSVSRDVSGDTILTFFQGCKID
ncbi:MAG: hypothetical protein QMD05_10560, partial [Candidatus Brocadiaceae bacterium]|nr:hypothetical protein [Candidatus Brocadiaceae bacterium]